MIKSDAMGLPAKLPEFGLIQPANSFLSVPIPSSSTFNENMMGRDGT